MKLDTQTILELTTASGGSYRVQNREEAYKFAVSFTLGHYENFPVGSFLIPKDKRNYIYSIYLFARTADDIADEMVETAPETRIAALDAMGALLDRMDDFADGSGNPIFSALSHTCKELNLPVETFKKLLIAFKRDVNFKQADNIADLEDYCTYSANPVGELILRVFGLYNEKTAEYSDAVCTGLQFVNFWQDISFDYLRNRVYIPKDILQKYDLENKDLATAAEKEKLESCISELCSISEKYFDKGASLIPYLKPLRLKFEIKATIAGGRKILAKIKKLGARTVEIRPKLNKSDVIKVLLRSIMS